MSSHPPGPPFGSRRRRLSLSTVESLPFGTYGGLVAAPDAPPEAAAGLLRGYERIARSPLVGAAHLMDLRGTAGGLVLLEDADVPSTRAHLDTVLFTIGAAETEGGEDGVKYDGYFSDLEPDKLYAGGAPVTLDLARFLAVRRSDAPEESVARHRRRWGYAFAVSDRRPDVLSEFDAYLDRLRQAGELDRLARRYLG